MVVVNPRIVKVVDWELEDGNQRFSECLRMALAHQGLSPLMTRC